MTECLHCHACRVKRVAGRLVCFECWRYADGGDWTEGRLRPVTTRIEREAATREGTND